MYNHGEYCFKATRFVVTYLQHVLASRQKIAHNYSWALKVFLLHSNTVAINFKIYIQRFIRSKTILISVLDWSMMETESAMEIKNDTSYLCIGNGELSFSCQKLLNFAQPLPPLSVINTMLSLSKLLAILTFLSRVSYRDIFSAKVLLCCHVPGCHEGALLDTVSRSRCEPHASNPKLRFAYYTPKPPNPWQLESGLTLQSLVFH